MGLVPGVALSKGKPPGPPPPDDNCYSSRTLKAMKTDDWVYAINRRERERKVKLLLLHKPNRSARTGSQTHLPH